jgi:protease-4
MKKPHIIAVVIAVVVVVVLAALVIVWSISGFKGYGNIGVIEVEGIITTPKYIVEELKDFKEDPSVAAIILRINSPGGSAAAAQEIYDELLEVKKKKKIVVSMGILAASAGYLISLPADVIVANPGTLTGSIGVIMQFPILEDLMRKIGIDFETIKSKDYKDIGSPYRRMRDSERRLLKDVVLDVYDQFVALVEEHRDLSPDSVRKFADGRIFSGRQAFAAGLIDTLGSFEDAVRIAAALVSIEKPTLVYHPPPLSLIDILLKPVESMLLSPRLEYIWE